MYRYTYITTCTFLNFAPKGRTEILQITCNPQVLAWCIQYQHIRSTDIYSPNCWLHISNTNIYFVTIYIFQPCARKAHRNPPTDVYFPNVGSIYPMQIYILPNVHFWAHRTLKLTQLLVWYIQYQYINTTDMYSSNLITNINITKYIFVLDIFCQQLEKNIWWHVSWKISVNPLGTGLGTFWNKILYWI